MSEKTEAMTAERIAEIKAREGKATPGPWVANEYASGVDLGYKPDHERTWGYGCGNDFVCDLNDGEYHEYCSQEEQRANAEFITHARQDIPDLLAEVERLRAENKRLERQVMQLAEAEQMRAREALIEAQITEGWFKSSQGGRHE